jgi:hypothetical protein
MPEDTSVVTIENWTVNSATFEEGAMLINNPSTANSIKG